MYLELALLFTGSCVFGCLWVINKFRTRSRIRDSFQEMHPVEIVWKIRNASQKLKTQDLRLETKERTLAGHKWSLVLEYKDLNLVLNLKKKDFLIPIYPSMFCGVGIEHCDRRILYRWHEVWVAVPTSNGISTRIWMGPSKSNLFANKDTLFPDDALTFFIRLSTYPSPFCTAEKNQKDLNDVTEGKKPERKVDERESLNFKALATLSKNLEDLYLEDKDHDVKIIVGSDTFGAHRAILKARSPVLSSMLEANTGEVRLEDCDPKDFAAFLLFLYSGTVDGLTGDNVASVYGVADKYAIPDLVETCAQYMLSTLTAHSVSDVIGLALKHGDPELMGVATEFFLKHAEQIFPTTEWQTFLRDHPTRANELVIKSYSFKK